MSDPVPLSPSARILAENAAFQAVAADGTHFTLRRMNVLDRLRLFRALGNELSGNEAYLGIAYLACAVTSIDDVPVPAPVNPAQIERLVGRLGDAGIAAIAEAFAALPGTETDPGN